MKMRQFLFMMNDLKLVNPDLTAKAIIDIFGSDDPKVADEEGTFNLELEVNNITISLEENACQQIP